MKVLFREVQKFNYWWIWAMLILITLIPSYGIYKQVILGIPFGDNPTSDIGLLVFLIIMLLLLLMFGMIRLTTEFTETFIDIRYFPFLKKRFHFSDIGSMEIVDYGFVGYGIRLGTSYGTVYNTRGSKGLSIVLNDGKKYCVGTQKPEEIQTVIGNLST